MTNFPPSLSKVTGKGDAQLEEEETLRKLCGAIGSLQSRSDEPPAEESAQDIYSTFLTAKVSVSHRRKKGYASPANVAKQLKQMSKGLATLEGRLASADKNVFEALRNAAEDREAAKKEWLELKRLLATMQDRAKRAACMAEVIVKALPQSKGKKGRPADLVADAVTIMAAKNYALRTGRRPIRSISRDTGAAEGEFHSFLSQLFQALGITASPNASNLRLQETLKAMR
jgi:hypothetical protein